MCYRRGAAFVLSSRHEAHYLAALEAAICGLPIAGTSVGAIPELTPARLRSPRASAAQHAPASRTSTTSTAARSRALYAS